MAQSYNFEPYYDDYSASSKFYKILFRPGVGVQPRELNQLQTILENQIEQHGRHFFKQGAMVIPGQSTVDMEVSSVKVSKTFNGLPSVEIYNQLKENSDVVILENSSGVKARVYSYVESENFDYYIVKFIEASGGNTEFEPLDTLSNGGVAVSSVFASSPIAKASIASIARGVYFVDGKFVLVEDQTIVLETESDSPSFSIGLQINYKIVTSDEDESLLDNAQGEPNFSAPGADREYIELALTKRDLDSTNQNSFVELIRIREGLILKKTNYTNYAELNKTLARRTYDQSGHFIVNGFNVDIREERDNNRGAFVPNEVYVQGDIFSTLISGKVVYFKVTAQTYTNGSAPSTEASTNFYRIVNNPEFNLGIDKEGSNENVAIGIEAGKAYVSGFEIDQISKQYVSVEKAREEVFVNNTPVTGRLGQFLFVRGLKTLPLPYQKIEFIDRCADALAGASVTATGYVKTVERTDESDVFKLYVHKVVNTDPSRSVEEKSFGVRLVGGVFVADLVFSRVILNGTLTVSGGVATGNGTLFLEQFATGDILLDPAGKHARVGSVSSNTSMTLAHVEAGFSTSSIPTARGIAPLFDTVSESAVFPLGASFVSRVEDETYVVFKTVNLTGSGVDWSVNIPQYDILPAGDSRNHVVVTNGGVVSPTNISVSGSTVTYTLPSVATSVRAIVMVSPSVTNTTKSKSKSISTRTQTFTDSQAKRQSITLDRQDGIRLVSVVSGGVDITSRYDFINGQTDYAYENCVISLKASSPIPSNDITVVYEFYEHSANGDYFSVASYASTPYNDIPSYKGTRLSDVLDFRSKVANDSGILTSSFPVEGQLFRVDMSYYIPRKDIVYINESGEISVKKGVSSVSPISPELPEGSMKLCDITLEPYGIAVKNIIIEKTDNRRYTMSDIGKIDKRVSRLEYFTSLSLLEQQTNAEEVIDGSGVNRVKNGFLVESFRNQNIADVLNPDFSCSIDASEGILRPIFTQKNVNLVPTQASLASGVRVNGDILTLDYQEKVFAQQSFASRIENVNPYAVFTFIGTVAMNPSTDEWFETNRLPDLVNNIEGNFNAVAAGNPVGINTVWNSWETVWVGTSNTQQTASRESEVFRNGNRVGNIGFTNTFQVNNTWEVTSLVGTSTRTGLQTSVQERFDVEVVGQRVVSTSVIPFIRARQVLIQSHGLKAGSTMKAVFDGVDVTDECKVNKIVRLRYTPSEGSVVKLFDFKKTFAEQAANDVRRSFQSRLGDIVTCLDKGDVVISGSVTGVVVGCNFDGTNYFVDIANTKGGTWNTSQPITTIAGGSGVIATIAQVVSVDVGLVVDRFGTLNLIFNIPNNSQKRFRTGTRLFQLVDDPIETTTSGRVEYVAKGTVNNTQREVNSIRNAELVQRSVTQSSVTSSTSRALISSDRQLISSQTNWYDPLAQTFLCEQPGGMFLTSIDLFFATKDPLIPVTVEIRNTVNGYPGQVVLPFSRVVKQASEVRLSSNNVLVEGRTVPAANQATRFSFEAPVYLEEGREYCFVILSDSNNYNVWVSRLGGRNVTNVLTDRVITEQPYNGVMFKSQNGSTWNADQLQDIKFTLYRAEFDVNAAPLIQFQNTNIPRVVVQNIQVTEGVETARLFVSEHGYKKGDILSVVVDGDISIGGLVTADIVGSRTVQFATKDYVVIAVGEQPTSSEEISVSNVTITQRVNIDTGQLIVHNQTFPDTSFTTTFNAADAFAIHTDAANPVVNANTWQEWNTEMFQIIPNENFNLSRRKAVVPEFRSAKVNMTIRSNNPWLSPVIDLARTSLIAIANDLDNPTLDNLSSDTLDEMDLLVDSNSGNITFNENTFDYTSLVVNRKAFLDNVRTGEFLLVTISSVEKQYKVIRKSATVIQLVGDGISNGALVVSTIKRFTNFVDVESPNTSTFENNYVSKSVSLIKSSNLLKVFLTANVVPENEVRLFARTSNEVDINEAVWKEVESDGFFRKAPKGTGIFNEVEYTLESQPFDKVQVKIVLSGTDSANPPMVKDLRIICCE